MSHFARRVCADRWHPRGGGPLCLCRGTAGRICRRGRRTGRSRSCPADPPSTASGTWTGNVHTCPPAKQQQYVTCLYSDTHFKIVRLHNWIVVELHSPDLQHRLVDVNALAIDAEFQVGRFRVVELPPQRLRHRQVVVLLWNKADYSHSYSFDRASALKTITVLTVFISHPQTWASTWRRAWRSRWRRRPCWWSVWGVALRWTGRDTDPTCTPTVFKRITIGHILMFFTLRLGAEKGKKATKPRAAEPLHTNLWLRLDCLDTHLPALGLGCWGVCWMACCYLHNPVKRDLSPFRHSLIWNCT